MKPTYIVYILCIAFAWTLASCGSDNSSSDSQTGNYGSGKLDQLVRMKIDSVRINPWDRKIYNEIRDTQIPMMHNKKAQEACMDLLKLNACLSIEKELYNLMHGKCENNHERMSRLYAELTGSEFKGTETGDSLHVRADYILHQKLYNQVLKHSARMNVSSFADDYDSKYDSITEKESKALYDSNKQIANRCTLLQNSLKKPNFRKRHQKYCEDIVSDFESAPSRTAGEQNTIIARMNRFENEFRNTSDWQDWNNRINAVKIADN